MPKEILDFDFTNRMVIATEEDSEHSKSYTYDWLIMGNNDTITRRLNKRFILGYSKVINPLLDPSDAHLAFRDNETGLAVLDGRNPNQWMTMLQILINC